MASNVPNPSGGDKTVSVTATRTYEYQTMTLTPEEEDIATQYRRMLQVGMPAFAVRQKMIIDGVDQAIQDSVFAREVPPIAESSNNGGGVEEMKVTTDSDETDPSKPTSDNSPVSAESESEYEEISLRHLEVKPGSSKSYWEEEEVVVNDENDENGRIEPLDEVEEEVLDDDGEYVEEEEFMEEVVDEEESMRRLAVLAAVVNDDNNMTGDEVYAANQQQFDPQQPDGEQQRLASTEDAALYRSGQTTALSSDDMEGQYQNREVPVVDPSLEQAPPPVMMYGVKEPAEKPRPSPSHWSYWLSCLVLVSLIGAGVGVGYSLASQDDDRTINLSPEDGTSAPTSGPTVGVTTEFEPVRGDCNFIGVEFPNPIDQCNCAEAILAIPTDVESRYQTNLDNFISTLYPDFDEDITSCSARNQALVWISSGNDIALTVEERTQNYALATIFASLGGAQWEDRTDWLTDTDPCTWYGLECDSTGFVSRMLLDGNNLTGVVST